MGGLADRLVALGADATSARYAAEALASGDAGPLLLMLLGRGFLADVVDEEARDGDLPAWMVRWRLLGEAGSPIIDVAALERLLAAGADADDLTDLVRSAQMLTAYNIANLIDDPSLALPPKLDVPDGTVDWSLMHEDTSGALARLGGLHEEVMSWDPSGRGGAPRSLDLRRYQSLPKEARAELRAFIGSLDFSKAALAWKRHFGGELADSLAAVQRLRDHRRALR